MQIVPDFLKDEAAINTQIQQVIDFPDYVTVRRDLVDLGFFTRPDDGCV